MAHGESGGGLPRSIATPFATVALTVLLLAALAFLGSLMIWQSYRAALSAGEARAMASAHVVAAHVQWMMEASDQALRRIDAALGHEAVRSSPDATADITEAVADLPGGFQYSVYDPGGRLWLSSVPEAVGISVADRDYFQALRDGAQVVVSPQLDDRLSGERVFVLARRITRGGAFQGAASIAIPIDMMATFWSMMELGEESTVAVVRTDGWLVARHPALEAAISLAQSPLFTTYFPMSTSGYYHSAVSPADGRTRIVGYRQVDGWPLVATAGMERSEALQPFRSTLALALALGLPAMALLVIGAIWIARLLAADAARRAALEEALERNRDLLREVHHRVKNNLQAVSSLVRLQPLPEAARQDMSRRIAAMIAVHEQIYGSDQFDRVEAAPYVERLVHEIAAGYDADVELEIGLEPLTVTRDQALPLGLIVNELVSNAFKHAFSRRKRGRLRVELKREAGGDGRLVVADDGPGGYDPGKSGKDKGMGGRLVAGFVAQIGGTFSVESGHGTEVRVSFPAAS